VGTLDLQWALDDLQAVRHVIVRFTEPRSNANAPNEPCGPFTVQRHRRTELAVQFAVPRIPERPERVRTSSNAERPDEHPKRTYLVSTMVSDRNGLGRQLLVPVNLKLKLV
jgi:hypothetical protein